MLKNTDFCTNALLYFAFLSVVDFRRHMDTDKKSSEVSLTSDLYEVDLIDQPRINNGLRRILCITIVICGMFFNGVVYGFPSPAELSFKKDHKIKNNLDRIFPK